MKRYTPNEFLERATRVGNGTWIMDADGEDVTVTVPVDAPSPWRTYVLQGPLSGSIFVEGEGPGDARRKGAGYGWAVRNGKGHGHAYRDDGGPGDAVRRGAGFGHAIRGDTGSGSAYRTGSGEGDASRSGAGHGSAYKLGDGKGDALRTGIGGGDAIKEGPGLGRARRDSRGAGTESDTRGTRRSLPFDEFIPYDIAYGNGILRVGCECETLEVWIRWAEAIDERHGDGIAEHTRALALRLQQQDKP